MKLIDTVVDKSRLYNPELKLAYIQAHKGKEGTKRIMYFEFINSAKVEKQYNKDLYAFNDLEVSDLLRSIGLSSDMSIQKTLSIYKDYVNWCIVNGQRGKYENGINYVEVFQKNEDVAKYISNRKVRNRILTKREVHDVIDILVNPIDQALIYSFYSLIGGKGAYEIRSLQRKNIDTESNIITLVADEGGKTRKHLADSKLIKHLIEANNQQEYIFNNGEEIGNGYKMTKELASNDYVFRTIKQASMEGDMVSYGTINQKFVRIKKYTGYDFISPKSLRDSRLIHRVVDITEEKGLYVADNEVFNKLNEELEEKYDIKLSPIQMYNLKQLYEKVIGIKTFD